MEAYWSNIFSQSFIHLSFYSLGCSLQGSMHCEYCQLSQKQTFIRSCRSEVQTVLTSARWSTSRLIIRVNYYIVVKQITAIIQIVNFDSLREQLLSNGIQEIIIKYCLQYVSMQITLLVQSMSLKTEIAELCRAIYQFETHISQAKQQLFSQPTVTTEFIWNHVIGHGCKKANQSQLVAFFQKHGIIIVGYQSKLIMWHFSSNKDNELSPSDLWQIFCPLTVKFTDEIMKTRFKKIVMAKFHEAHYKISDLLCDIMRKTIYFLRKSHKMKKNIVDAKPEPMIIEPLDSIHLMMYINDSAPDLLLKDVQIIFKHIMRNQIVCRKTFQQYFIPIGYKTGDLNPNFIRENEFLEQFQGIELIKHHMQNVSYVKNTHKKVLYLHEKQYAKTMGDNRG